MKCPFLCGDDVYTDSHDSPYKGLRWFVRCNNGDCGAIGPWGGTQKEAESKWNDAFATRNRNGLPVLQTGGFVASDVELTAARLEKKLRLQRSGIK